jgi:glycosyltransferase involved in cell wall biosynthesis/GT2 family glycosyltransferase
MINPANPDYSNTPIADTRVFFHYAQADDNAYPLVTIITPFYNTGLVFHDTARSILNQSFQQWEWLIVNDGSTMKESLLILQEYRNLHPRIIVIDLEANKGLSAARNAGFAHARAEYVVQIDSDDLLEPTAIEKWYWFLNTHPEFAFVKGYTVGFGAQQYLWTRGFHEGKYFLYENLVAPTCMIRKSVHQACGGYDESMREGLEDWDFWLRCANSGHWGATVEEYLDWYRRRLNHNDRWANWNTENINKFRANIRHKYPSLKKKQFLARSAVKQNSLSIAKDILRINRLAKRKSRLLLIVPWLALGGADKYNLNLVSRLVNLGWEVTIATTLKADCPWLHEFSKYTPDIFTLHKFLHLSDYPAFYAHLITSREPDIVLISNSEMSYLLLPYLRSYFPNQVFVDLCHIEEDSWRNGGFPALSVTYQIYLDINVVVSHHLKKWMVERGADESRIEVCYINVDQDVFRPDRDLRNAVRRELNITQHQAVIVYAGRLCDQKQPRVFAKVMSALSNEAVDFIALVAGDGEDRKWLEKYIKKNNLCRCVKMLGNVPVDRMQGILSAGDIFFLPSKHEGISLAVYEAMSTALCVVTADAGGQRELVTEETGILVQQGSGDVEVERYTDVLRALLNDIERCRRIGIKARERIVASFTADAMLQNVLRVFEKARFNHENILQPLVDREEAARQALKSTGYMSIFGHGETPVITASIGQMRLKIYSAIADSLANIYWFCIRKRWTWIIPVKNLIRRLLQVDE